MIYPKLLKISLLLAFFAFLSCNDDEGTPSLRAGIDYALITPETPYSQLFVDAAGNTTVDLHEGNDRYKMFQALNYHSTSSISNGVAIEESALLDMFSNTNDPFYDISTPTVSVTGEDLNNSGVLLRDVVASSLAAPDAEVVREKIESYFTGIDIASQSVNNTASPGVAGKLGTYLVDTRGLEVAQLIQKSLIGALQLDYIGNVLLDEGLDADNFSLVEGKNYTQLEHNWDVAYGLLTLNPIYLEGSTDAAKGTVEFGAGSYIWEYNKTAYPEIYPAFLKGRAAIVNNDRDQYVALATYIRTEMEKAVANAAIGYLKKWKDAAGDKAKEAHALGEGHGFIYSLRFAKLHEADAAFSNTILENLVGTEGGLWDMTNDKVNAAIAAIEAKFEP